jgi:hypothetical protein
MMSSMACACLVLLPVTLHSVSGMTSAVWSHPVLSICYTEHSSYHGAVLSDHIISVTMFRSGQLSRCCTVETNCSGLHVCKRFSNA